MAKDPFEGVMPHLRYHYGFILTRQPPPDVPHKPRSRFNCPKLPQDENRAFLDFITQNLAEDDWRVKLSGTHIMRLWTADNDWEMLLKLSEAFPDHMSGIIQRDVRE